MNQQIGIPPKNINSLEYTGSDLSLMATAQFNRDPIGTDRNYPIQTIARNTITQDEWILVGFVSGLANWKKFTGGSVPGGTVISISDNSGTKALPDVSGNIQLTQSTGITVVTTGANQITITDTSSPSIPIVNLGVTLAAGVFSITSANGTALSASNPGYVTIPSKTNPGQMVTIKITANESFKDASTGSSDIIGNTFGTTAGVAWGSDCPFFIYAALNSSAAIPETAVSFFIARFPNANGTSGTIAKAGSAIASTEDVMFSISSSITVADYINSSGIYVGWFAMKKSAADDWTVSALDYLNGVNRFPLFQFFTLPSLQNGATSNIFSSTVGGDTIPVFSQTGNAYTIDRVGSITFLWNFDNINFNGVGAGQLQFSVPFRSRFSSTVYTPPGSSQYKNSGAGTYQTTQAITRGLTLAGRRMFSMMTQGSGTSLITPADWTTDKTDGSINITYLI